MSDLYHVAQTLHAYWWTVPLVVLAWLNIRDFWRGTTLIARVLYAPRTGRVRAGLKLARIFVNHPWLFLSWSKATRFRAARLFAEVEILNPKSAPPNPNDFSDRRLFRQARREWRDAGLARRRHTADYMREQLAEQRSSFYSRVWEVCTRVFRPRKHRPSDGGSRSSHFVPVSSFASLDESRPLIKRYFSVLASLSDTDTTFVSTTQIDIGYFAPLFLITGVINRFKDEDGWKLVIDNYRKLVEQDKDYSEELRELRAFLFNCWLLWGPSIPPCSCQLWSPREEDRQSDLNVQYGFGDENNSVDLLIKDGLNAGFLRNLQLELSPAPMHAAAAATPLALCAVPYTVTGRFGWGPHLHDDHMSPAQRMIQGGSADLGLRDPNRGRVFLQCDRRDCDPRDVGKSARYYSAYLWIIFVIVDQNGDPFYPADPQTKINSWKNLLCYFEHGNIADATTYQTLKENLIAKSCSSLREILQRERDMRPGSDGGRGLKVKYACAFDDSNCGPNNAVRFPPAEILPYNGASRKARLVDILRISVAADAELGSARNSGRLILPDGDRSELDNPFSSCHLPSMIEIFYKELKGAAELLS